MTDTTTAPADLPQPPLQDAARVNKTWPFEEARKLVRRYPNGKRDAVGNLVPVLFETGYGPSGLPHIGTFTEVLRTTLVRRAYEVLAVQPDGTPPPTRLVAFSDDMDGLRKVPDNVPDKDMLAANLGRPLSRIPDPFGTHASFAHHNNARLRDFLDQFGFDYEFVSASDRYNAGGFDDALINVLRHYDAIMGIMLPTLREERRQTYSPVLPISPTTGTVLQVPIEIIDAAAGMIRFTDADGTLVEQSILGGRSKLQWKVDWAMRWVALGVDYEMFGKDLTDSGTQSGKIAAAVDEVLRRFGGVVGIHTHNDSDVGVANTLAAVDAGAAHVQGCMLDRVLNAFSMGRHNGVLVNRSLPGACAFVLRCCRAYHPRHFR